LDDLREAMMGKTLKFGIVGMTSDHVWGMGANLAALPQVEIVTGAEPVGELRDRAKERFGLATVYEDMREMYANEEVDAILVCSDNAAKAGIVEEAAKHGVHVYQDKPMAATLAQADRMIAAAEAAGIKLMIGYHNYFGAAYGKVKDLLDEGQIGDVYLVRALIGHAGPKEVGCDPYFCEWLFDQEKNGGGTFIDEGCYALSAFLDYLGPVEEVSAFMTQIGYRDYLPADVEDNSVAILRFQSGALGVLDAKWGQIGPMPFGSSYHGTEGTITTSWGGMSVYSRRMLPADLQGWVEVSSGRGRQPRPGIGSEPEYFVNCLLEDKPIEGPVSPRGARATQEVIEAAYLSAKKGEVVKLPL
jgi:predicted dehydrogenase